MSITPPACLVHTSLPPLLAYSLKQCPLMPKEYAQHLETLHKKTADYVNDYIQKMSDYLQERYNKMNEDKDNTDAPYKKAIEGSFQTITYIKNNLLSPSHMNVWELAENYGLVLYKISPSLETVLETTDMHLRFKKTIADLYKGLMEATNILNKGINDFKSGLQDIQANNTANS